MPFSSQAIGLFDSGVGGLTVMRQLMKELPAERFLYFGDTARVPYGNKSPETILEYSIEIARFLVGRNIKLLVIACNTSTAFALHKLKELFPIPIIGVIEAGASTASAVSRNGHIAVLATRGTIQSGAYQSALMKIDPRTTVYPLACPLLVPLVEERWHAHPAARMIVGEYLKALPKEIIDTVLLGCTHYPFLDSLIRDEMGPNTVLVDSASTCALQVMETLKTTGRLASHRSEDHLYFTSDDPDRFRFLAEDLFDSPIGRVEKVDR